jgi:hypothetical protein
MNTIVCECILCHHKQTFDLEGMRELPMCPKCFNIMIALKASVTIGGGTAKFPLAKKKKTAKKKTP